MYGEHGPTFDVRKVCWDPPVGVGQTCTHGADCTTRSCNAATNTCNYYCYPGRPDVEAGNGEGASVPLDIEKGRCSEEERCGDTTLSVLVHACEPKYEVSNLNSNLCVVSRLTPNKILG